MTINVSLQSSVGRFDLELDPTLTLRDVKRAFRKEFADLSDVNMATFLVSYKGLLLSDDSVTLKACGIDQDNAVLFLIRKRNIPPVNRPEAE